MIADAQLARATLIRFNVVLSGSTESPAVITPATGFGSVDLDTVAQTLHLLESFSGLTSGTTASHIHCCLASPFLLGSNVQVATTTPLFLGFPLGVTAATFEIT